MPSDLPISGLAELVYGQIDDDDEVVVVDKSDVTMGAPGTNKRVKLRHVNLKSSRYDANHFVTSGQGIDADPWILDTASIALIPNGSTIVFREGMIYGTTNTSGLTIPENKKFIRLIGNGATIRNTSGSTSQCIMSFGGWNTDGTPKGSNTDADWSCHAENFILDGGPDGATVGLRIHSSHYGRFNYLDIRNYKTIGVINRGGIYTTFWFCNCGYRSDVAAYTQYYTPENGFVLDKAIDGVGGSGFPGSAICLFHCEVKGHSKDGFRILNNFDTVLYQCAAESVIQGPIYSVADGPTSTPPYTGDGSWADKELYMQGNKGAGVYIGGYALTTTLVAFDGEYSGEDPENIGYKMGAVVDAGAFDTVFMNCSQFNANICILAGAKRTTIFGGDNGVRANGHGVKIIGGRHTANILRGPNLLNFSLSGGDYDDFKFDIEPPKKIGGFIVGYDYYNNSGPIEAQVLPMLYHYALTNPYPDYMLMQDSIGRSRLNGSTEVTLRNGDVINITVSTSGSTQKLGFFGAAAAAKPTVTGQRGTSAAAASFLSALAALGLITDSTSAPSTFSGSADLGASYTLTTTMANTGLSITLPAAGTYLITCNVRFGVQGNYSLCQLYDSTNSAYVGSVVMGHLDSSGVATQTTVGMSQLITVTGATTIQLHAKVNTVTATGYVYSDSGTGITSMKWTKVQA